MEKSSEKTILIGREPGKGRLLVSISVNGQTKNAAIGEPDSVPPCVSRCKPEENRAHCKLLISENGDMSISNMNRNNVTYVSGREIVSKKIASDANVSLGKDMYPVNIGQIMTIVEKITQNETSSVSQKDGFSIRHLEKVWNTYHDDMFNLQKRQKNLALIKGFYMPLTILSSIVGIAAKHIGLNQEVASTISFVMYAIAALILFYGLYRSIADKSLEEKEQISGKFMKEYVCPNPECRHFMGNQPYKILKQNTSCPYCKCKFTEK